MIKDTNIFSLVQICFAPGVDYHKGNIEGGGGKKFCFKKKNITFVYGGRKKES